jgi:hypothetical protein
MVRLKRRRNFIRTRNREETHGVEQRHPGAVPLWFLWTCVQQCSVDGLAGSSSVGPGAPGCSRLGCSPLALLDGLKALCGHRTSRSGNVRQQEDA